MCLAARQQALVRGLFAALGSVVLMLSATSAASAAQPPKRSPDARQGGACRPATESKACSPGAATSAMAVRLTTLLMPQGPSSNTAPYQGWLDGSRVPTPPGEVTYFNDRCPFAYPNADPAKAPRASGCVVGKSSIYLFQAPEDLREDRAFARFEFMHEVGHIYENVLFANDPRYQQRVRTILGDSRSFCAWNGDLDGSGRREVCHAPPNEYFADAYAFCSLYGLDRRIPEGERGAYGYEPGYRDPYSDAVSVTQREHQRLCRFIVRIAKRAGMDVSGLTSSAQRGSAGAREPGRGEGRARRHRQDSRR